MNVLTFLLATVVLGISGCTTVGVNTRERATIDYGPPVTLSVCVLRSPGVTPQRVDELVAAVNTEFAPYGIQIIVPWQHDWTRAGFTHTSLFDDVARRDLEPPCDRLVALVDRNAGDFPRYAYGRAAAPECSTIFTGRPSFPGTLRARAPRSETRP
jgi:hypothetical protein